MNQKQKEETIRLVKDYCLVKIQSPYLDGFASVFEDADGWKISSPVWGAKPLEEQSFFDLSFYKVVPT